MIRILIFLFIIAPSIAYAAPAITSVTGTLSHGESITIGGSAFGVKSPVAPLLWDNVDDEYTGIANQGVVPVGSSYVWENAGSGVDVYFKTTNPRGKFTAKYTNEWSTNIYKRGDLGGNNYPGITTLYVSWWMWLDKSACTADVSNKYTRFTDDAGWSSTVQGVIWGPDLTQIYGVGAGQKVDWTDTCGKVDQWQRMEETVISGTSPYSPHVFLTVDNSPRAAQPITGNFDLLENVTGIGSIGADWSNTLAVDQPTLDWGEIYVDNTRARVELCNASVKADATHCEIQIPHTTWGDTSLQITFNQGTWVSGNTAYLFVIDADGAVNAEGEEITIDEEASDTTPPVRSNGSPTGTLDSGTTSVDMTLGTNETATCKYHASDVAYASMSNTFTSTAAQTHSETLTSLSDGNTYTYYIRCQDDEGTPNVNDDSLVITFNVAAAAETCADDVTLCDNATDCTAEWSYNFCPEETPPCQSAACDSSCDEDHFYLCETQSPCESAGLYWWEGACRTVAQPQNIDGANLLSNQDVTALTWVDSLPVGWDSYSTATEHSLGVRLADAQQIMQSKAVEIVSELTRYCYVVNIVSITGQLKIYFYDTNLWESTVGTKTGCFETPAEPISDHSLYFEAAAGANDVVANYFGLWVELQYTRTTIDPTGQAASIDSTGTAVSIGN